MEDSTKALLGGLIASITIIGSFAVMADCSKSVSRTGSEAVEACVRAGGQWIGRNAGQNGDLNFCQMPEAKK